jgi:hypothetical protein
MALFRSAFLTGVTIASSFATVAIANATPAAAAHVAAPVATPVVVAAPAPVRVKPAVVRKAKPKATPKPTPKATPKASPKASPKPSPKPVVTHKSSPSPSPTATHRATTSLSFSERLKRAVARIPGYRDGDAVWVVRKQSTWGLALMGGGTVYISPTVPNDKIYSVASHEWSHLVSVRTYGNHVQEALDAMNAYFGGSGLTGAERAADCMARQLGATWTNYTPCTNTRWIAGAKKLLAGQQL